MVEVQPRRGSAKFVEQVALDTEAQVVPRLTSGFEVRFWHVAVGAEFGLSAVTSAEAQLAAVF